MEAGQPQPIAYQRANFSTLLPAECLYTPSHFWLARREGGVWRVGFARFAIRMLGDMVDHEFQVAPGSSVQAGQILGWVEGFKAISDVLSEVVGSFLGGNPALRDEITLINKDPYAAGWLYEVQGRPDPHCIEVRGYCALLDRTIDRMRERQRTTGDG
jgi:glycine cleavage system H protein